MYINWVAVQAIVGAVTFLALLWYAWETRKLRFEAPPTGAELDEVEELSNRLSQIGFDILGYLFDLRVAAQNLLLTGVFPGRVQER